MNPDASEFDPVEELADDFVERYRRGERPSLSEYIGKYPELAERIRELIPTLMAIEELGSLGGGTEASPTGKILKVSEQLGEYRIVREVAAGGMGVVYEAVQESLGRHVALKVLPFHATLSPTYLERFRREAQSAARLHHTNIVPVFGVGEHNGLHYYAMQFIQGLALNAVLRELRQLLSADGKVPPHSALAHAAGEGIRGDRAALGQSVASGLLSGRFLGPDHSALTTHYSPAEHCPPISTVPGSPGQAPPEVHSVVSAGSETCAERTVVSAGAETRAQRTIASIKVAGDASELTSQSETQYFRSVARVGVQVAEALDYAHQQGIIHRDIKPSNLLLDTRGTVWVTDFGLAKAADSDELTTPGDIVGTVRYMAPERFQGITEPRSDVYSLGATLYEMLTLQAPFDDSDKLHLIERVTNEDPPPPRKVDGQIPRDLETIVLKALDKDPRMRFQSAAELADELRLFLADRPLHIRRSTWPERFWRWCRRNPVVAGLSVGLAAMGLLVCIGSLLAALRLGRSTEQARRAERDAKEQLFDSLLVQAHAGRTSQQPGQRLNSLRALAQATRLGRALERGPRDLLQLRNEAIACLALPDLTVEAEWEGNQPGTNGLGFDAAFERYAWSFQEEGIRVRRLSDHVEQFRLPTPPSDRVSRWVLLSFCPNGRYLAAYYVQWAEKHPLEVWDLSESGGRRVVNLPDASGVPVFTADSGRLVAPLPKGETAIIELPFGVERRRLSSGGPADAVALHPGGKLLAVAGGQTDGVRVLDLDTGSVAHRLPHADTVQGLAWSPDGKLLATACNDLHIHLWDAVSWRKEGELTGHRWEVGDVAFDPTGKWLASFGWDMTLRVWEVGSRRQVLNVEDIRVLSFCSQGQLAAAGVTGQRVQVWGFRPSEVFQELHPFQTANPSIRVSPGGRWMITSRASESDFSLWDVGTCREVSHQLGQRWSFGPDETWFITFGKDGLSRVPVLRSGLDDPPAIRFGQPRHLAGLLEDVRQDSLYPVGPEGRRLLLIDPPEANALRSRMRMLDLNGDAIRVLWEGHKPNTSSLAASRDGSLLAMGSYGGGSGVSIWEVDTGRLVRELPIGDAQMSFAADGRRLYTATGRLSPRGAECRSWWIGSWEPDRALALKRVSHSPAGLSVAADGTLAIAFTMSDVRLLNSVSLEEIATLSAPHPGLLHGVEISTDGATLVSPASGTVQIWNLRRLRQELAGLELDWTASLPPASQAFPDR